MNVGTICKRHVVTAREGDELNAAAQLTRYGRNSFSRDGSNGLHAARGRSGQR